MHRLLRTALSTATVVAAFGLVGCSRSEPVSSPSAEPTVPTTTSEVAAVPVAPLPAPDALTAVLARLADPAVPGTEKLNLVEGATPDSAAKLDKFSNALRDGGYLPLTFTANDLAWSDKNPSNVMATVSVNTAQPNRGVFTFPMEFTPSAAVTGGWQLSKRTADMLLALNNSQSPSPPAVTPPAAPAPTESPSPAPAPAPAPAPSESAGPSPSPTPPG
jgi:hypothetical protein